MRKGHEECCPAGILDGERAPCLCGKIQKAQAEKEGPKLGQLETEAERLKRELVEQSENLGKNRGIRTQIIDGETWMVSVIHPSIEGGSYYHSDRAGKDARQAAISYLMDSDNLGAELAHKDPEMTLIVVVDPTLAPSRKQWKVHLFTPVYNKDRHLAGVKEFS